MFRNIWKFFGFTTETFVPTKTFQRRISNTFVPQADAPCDSNTIYIAAFICKLNYLPSSEVAWKIAHEQLDELEYQFRYSLNNPANDECDIYIYKNELWISFKGQVDEEQLNTDIIAACNVGVLNNIQIIQLNDSINLLFEQIKLNNNLSKYERINICGHSRGGFLACLADRSNVSLIVTFGSPQLMLTKSTHKKLCRVNRKHDNVSRLSMTEGTTSYSGHHIQYPSYDELLLNHSIEQYYISAWKRKSDP